MIIRLNTDGTITIVPRRIPEPIDNIYLQYEFPKGLNHLRPVLIWGGVKYEGQNKHISKAPIKFDMRVILYNGDAIFKEYYKEESPQLFVGYDIEQIEPDLLNRLNELELENQTLKERGDII